MRHMKVGLSAFVLGAGMWALTGTGVLAATMTLEGTVTDAKCGAKHPVADSAACVKECVDHGSDYALVVGDKVYTLKASTAPEKAELAKLAGKMAKVTGDVTNQTVMVKMVAMGMAPKK